LVLDFALPSPTSLPQVGEVKYDSKINALKEIPVSNVWLTETYRGMIIKMALRTIYELFQSDVADALDSIAFNGSIRAIDRSIGQEASVFLICLEASKVEFATINLAQVEPEACFARLGGVLSENLAGSRTPLRSTQSPL
jgi:restriction system protein